MKKLSRRAFLKSGLFAAAGAAASTTALPVSVKGASSDELATLIDLSKCVGCEECVFACRQANEHKYPNPAKPFPKMYPDRAKPSDWSDKKDVTDRLTPYNWLFIQRATVDYDGEEMEINVPRRCMHCQNPPCADLCPFGSAKKLKNGITRIDADVCFGGAKCKAVCPWKIPERQTGVGLYLDVAPGFVGNGVMYKCDRCYDKVAKGEIPACISACPEGVQTIGLRHEIVAQAKKIAREMDGYIYGEKENGGTNTIYVSPVPFEEINKAIEKGPGSPHMGPVKNAMAHADNLTKALFVAPVAGIAASVLRLVSFAKKTGETNQEES